MTLQIKPSQLLKESRDAMLELLDCGVVLYMSWYTDRGGRRLSNAPFGTICGVCAGAAWSHMHGGKGDGLDVEERALDDFRVGDFAGFADRFGEARRQKIERRLSGMRKRFFRGLIADPVPLLDHFDDAIGRLERAGL